LTSAPKFRHNFVMRLPPRFAVVVTLGIGFVLALPELAHGCTGMMNQSIDALYNLRDQLQGVVMKSVHGVGEAMQEGPAREGPGESTIDYYRRMHHKLHDLAVMDKNLLQAQRQLQKVDLQIMAQLPKGDPRRRQIAAEIKHVGNQAMATRQSMQNYQARAAKFNQAIQQYHQRHGQ
jgi:hypothetical protein